MPIDTTRLDHNGDECFDSDGNELTDDADSLDSQQEDGANDDENFVILLDPQGVELSYIFLLVIDLKDDPDAGRFVALTPFEESEDPEAPTEILLFHYGTDDHGNETYSSINDDELFARVQAAAEEYFAQVDAENEHADNIELATHQAVLADIDDQVTATGPELEINLPTEELGYQNACCVRGSPST
jgi:uncharacterized protein YrzB (UPF0473 family)